ncbi:unnamed protein product [Linum trigynum]|uniref:Integrase catalytic domain-containing protein n=1 Tax=Linum trigynum TaxID=586398 RepID=A0AAV2DBP4_9ROSI
MKYKEGKSLADHLNEIQGILDQLSEAKISSEIVNSAENGDTIELWHKRLSHMSEKSMAKLAQKKFIVGLDHVHLKKCADCLAGKQNRVAFKSSIPSKAKNVLDLVHSDLYEPNVNVKSLGGVRYFLAFIDDHSRKTWVYTLKTKDQAIDVFKQFLALLERETGKKLKCIRTDNGREYRGPFATFCKEHGIWQQFIPPKMPQLNGLVEMMNMTLLERVRCLLSHSKLPQSFWGEALLASVYVRNRSPSVPLKYDAPEKRWSCDAKPRDVGCRTCADYARSQLSYAADFVLNHVFLQHNATDQRGYQQVKLFGNKFNASHVAYTGANEIYFSADFIETYSAPDLKREFSGVLHREMAHVWL